MLRVEASYITLLLFAGTTIGSPLVGWASDYAARRKPLMIAGAIASIATFFFIIQIPHLSVNMLMALFFLLGFFSSTQIIGYPLVSESSKRIVTAMSVSVVNISTIGGIGLIQRLYGYLLQTHAQTRTHHMTRHYLATDFHWAMLIFLGGFLLALLTALLVKETYCVQQED